MEDEFYRTFELRRRDKNSIVEIFRPGYCDMAVSTAASVAEAKRWIDDHLDLEQTIADLLDRKKELEKELDIDSPEYELINRELTGLRNSREHAGGIIEDLDPVGWGATCRPHKASPATEPRQVLPFRTRTTVKPQQDSEELKEREQRKLDPKRQDLVRRIVAGHPETKWGPKELQELHDELEAWGE
jgi:hypothetical protein